MKFIDQYSLASSGIFYIQSREEVNLQLQLDHRVSTYLTGTVFNTCKKTITNASVSLYDQDNNFLHEVETNKKGIYCFEMLEPNIYYIDANADGYILSNRIRVVIENHSITKQDFFLLESQLHFAGIIYGRIFDKEIKKPLEDIEITVINTDNHQIVGATLTNEEGQYIIYNVKPGDYKIVVKPFQYVQAHKYISIYGGDTIQKNFHLKEKCNTFKNSLRGKVTSQNVNLINIPVFLFKVKNEDEILVQTQLTNDNGDYQFNQLLSGTYIVKAKLQNDFGQQEIINISVTNI